MDAMVAHHALSIGLDRFITLEAQSRANPDAYAQSMADEYAERVRISTDVLAQMVKAFA
jgi:hypothetical protein